MAGIKQHIALGLVNDELNMFVDLVGTRGKLKGERESEEHPFIQFVNAKNLPELLISVDKIYDIYGRLDFILDQWCHVKPKPVEQSKAAEVASIFEEHPTRTTIGKTKEALDVWHFDKMSLGEDAKDYVHGMTTYLCMPFKDLVEAKEDLRRTSMLMAWLVGKCTFQMAHGLEPAPRDLKNKFKTIGMEKDTYLAYYYELLQKNCRNNFDVFNIHNTTYHLHHYDEKTIESTVRSYVASAFSLLMSDVTRRMNENMIPYTQAHSILSAAWSFFAEGLNKENAAGSILVCKHCGRFFQPKRSTKVFCGNSCRVSYLREHSGEPQPQKIETQVSLMRRNLQKQ